MQKLYEPNSGILTVKYLPEDEIVSENPPKFSWLPATEDNNGYTLEISQTDSFENALTYKNININFFSPDKCLAVGKWFWRYSVQAGSKPLYSKIRCFTVSGECTNTPQPLRENRLKNTDTAHPRLWMTAEKIEKFRGSLKENANHCAFDQFYNKAVIPLLAKPFVNEPLPYPNNKRVIALWRQSYQDCQTAYNYIRFLSIAGVILEDNDIISKAVQATVAIAMWNVHGTTSRDYNDESAFRVTGAIAWGYDWLYNFFTSDERNVVYNTLVERTKEVAAHALVSSKIHYSLFDSHAVRSLSSVLVPCSIAMLHENEQAQEWLQYTIDYFNVLYTPWGGTDGGWSEGGMYWTTGMAYLIEALNLIKNYVKIDLFVRPFFQHTADFPFYCFAHDTLRASFCDQSNLGDKPILKTGFNVRELAGVTKNQLHQWYFEQISKREGYDDQRFFNTGWWNFYYDEMIYQSNYKPVKAAPPSSGRMIKHFRDIGWVAMHNNMHNENEHIAFLMKSSPYGSVSHSHADQNGFTLHAFKEPLLIESGYYIGFNSSMHRNWRRQTKSTNNILISGEGQYAGMDKTKQLAAVGCITSVEHTPEFVKVTADATKAYLPNVPSLDSCKREIYFVNDSYFIVVDTVNTTQKTQLSYLLHSLYKPTLEENGISIKGANATLNVIVVYASAGIANSKISDDFIGVDPAEIKGLDKHWHYTLNTNEARKHVLITCLLPYKTEEYDTVEAIKDDQGHDVYLYFTHCGKTFSLCVDGNVRY